LSYRFSKRARQSEVSGSLPTPTGHRLLHDEVSPYKFSATPSWLPGRVFVRRARDCAVLQSDSRQEPHGPGSNTCCPGTPAILGLGNQLFSLAPASGIPPRRLTASNCRAFVSKTGDIFFSLKPDLEGSQPPGMKHNRLPCSCCGSGVAFRPWQIPPATVGLSQEPCPQSRLPHRSEVYCAGHAAQTWGGAAGMRRGGGSTAENGRVADHRPGDHLVCSSPDYLMRFARASSRDLFMSSICILGKYRRWCIHPVLQHDHSAHPAPLIKCTFGRRQTSMARKRGALAATLAGSPPTKSVRRP
jgi:hypothetical protein